MRRRAALVEVIDQLGIRIVGALGVDRSRSLSCCRSRARYRSRYPATGSAPATQTSASPSREIELLDVMLQRRLVVAGDEAEIAAVVLGRAEAEIADMQPHQHRRGADRIGDVGAGCAGIDRDLLAQLTIRHSTRRWPATSDVTRRDEPEQQPGRDVRDAAAAPAGACAAEIETRPHQNSPQIRKFTRGLRAVVYA